MKLTEVTIQKFRNIVDAQTILIEPDVTCLIGKNESGKTTILKALHRLNPANGDETKFNLTTEYPRWRLARDRRGSDLEKLRPVSASFVLEEDDLNQLQGIFGVRPPNQTLCQVSRDYDNKWFVKLTCPFPEIIRVAGSDASLSDSDIEELLTKASTEEVQQAAKDLAKTLKDGGESARAKVLSALPGCLARYNFVTTNSMEADQRNALGRLVPKFFYFSKYDLLPGEVDLDELAEQVRAGGELEPEERTMVALLARAGEGPEDFLDSDYDSRRAELQASSLELTQRVFDYWKQNTDLEVEFDTDMVEIDKTPNGEPAYHRFLKVELRDQRHGGVATNFATRSSGFQWFFSFFAAFSEYQESNEPIIVLLDEPGTSLHGEAQKDFIRFVFEELGESKQTIYTTHSQFMVDPARYEKLRAVHDRATRQQPDLGVLVSDVSLSADAETLLPVESALGYSVSQHLFLGGGHHLAVEGSSDFVYLQRLTEYLQSVGKSGLDPKLAIIPVGGDGNMPAFVALLGRRLKVSALIDGDRSRAKYQRVLSAAEHNGVSESSLVVCGEVDGKLPNNSDIEDVFAIDDYLWIYNCAFNDNLLNTDLPQTDEPILRRIGQVRPAFDHAIPAHALTDHRNEFFGQVRPETLTRFEALFAALNKSLA